METFQSGRFEEGRRNGTTRRAGHCELFWSAAARSRFESRSDSRRQLAAVVSAQQQIAHRELLQPRPRNCQQAGARQLWSKTRGSKPPHKKVCDTPCVQRSKLMGKDQSDSVVGFLQLSRNKIVLAILVFAAILRSWGCISVVSSSGISRFRFLRRMCRRLNVLARPYEQSLLSRAWPLTSLTHITR